MVKHTHNSSNLCCTGEFNLLVSGGMVGQNLTTFGERQNGTNFVEIVERCHQFLVSRVGSSWSKGDKVSKR